MALTPHDGTGTTLAFAGSNYTVTNIVYTLGEQDNNADSTIDVSHLGLTAGSSVATQDRPLVGSVENGGTTGREVQIEYLGKSVLADGSTGTLSITHNGVSFLSAAATVSASSVTFALNDAVRGQATFRVAR